MISLLLLTAFSAPAGLPPAQVTAVADGVYVHTTSNFFGDQPFPSNGLIVQTAAGVVLVDTGWGLPQTAQVLRWVRRHLHQPVALCIVTHAHEDRMGGGALLRKQGIRMVSTALTAARTAQQGLPHPDGMLPADTTLLIGGVAVRTFFPGAGHTPDNIVVWLPAQRVLFGGCLVKSCDAGTLGNMAEADMAAWPATIRRVQQTFPTARMIIPGHQKWACADPLTHTLELLGQRAD